MHLPKPVRRSATSDLMHQPIILQRDFDIQRGVVDVVPDIGDATLRG